VPAMGEKGPWREEKGRLPSLAQDDAISEKDTSGRVEHLEVQRPLFNEGRMTL